MTRFSRRLLDSFGTVLIFLLQAPVVTPFTFTPPCFSTRQRRVYIQGSVRVAHQDSNSRSLASFLISHPLQLHSSFYNDFDDLNDDDDDNNSSSSSNKSSDKDNADNDEDWYASLRERLNSLDARRKMQLQGWKSPPVQTQAVPIPGDWVRRVAMDTTTDSMTSRNRPYAIVGGASGSLYLLVGEGLMAYEDTLFQLGMDLTRSSTAQKEDIGEVAFVDRESGLERLHAEDRKDFFIERDGVRYAGNHLLIDLFGAKRLDDIKLMESAMKRCVEVAGATLLHIHLHHFTPNGGVSGVAVLSESHISVHSWPEADYAAFDVFMCGEAKPELAVEVLREAFSARDVVVRSYRRGEEMDELEWKASAARKAPLRVAQKAA